MFTQIDAIFLDVGNTLRILLEDDQEHRAKARRRIVELLGAEADPEEFCAELDRRYKTYRKWAFKERVEAHEPELWTRWLVPDFPAEQVAANAVELTYQYRQSMGRRVVAEDGAMVVKELYARGYTLGIISNVITSREIPDWLESDGLDQYFKSVALSSVLGVRKPARAIYDYATSQAGVRPEHSAYVGDNLDRDITGTREAGFGAVVILLHEGDARAQGEDGGRPDVIIRSLGELLDIFPPRYQGREV